MAVCSISLNDFNEALRFYREARDYCGRHGMPLLVAEADYNIAYLHYLRGEYALAIELYHAARMPLPRTRRPLPPGALRPRRVRDVPGAEPQRGRRRAGPPRARAVPPARPRVRDRQGHRLPRHRRRATRARSPARSSCSGRRARCFCASGTASGPRSSTSTRPWCSTAKAPPPAPAGWPAPLSASSPSPPDRQGRRLRIAARPARPGSRATSPPPLAAATSALERAEQAESPPLSLPGLVRARTGARSRREDRAAARRAYRARARPPRKICAAIWAAKSSKSPSSRTNWRSTRASCAFAWSSPTAPALAVQAFGYIEQAKSRSLADLIAFRAHSLPAAAPGGSALGIPGPPPARGAELGLAPNPAARNAAGEALPGVSGWPAAAGPGLREPARRGIRSVARRRPGVHGPPECRRHRAGGNPFRHPARHPAIGVLRGGRRTVRLCARPRPAGNRAAGESRNRPGVVPAAALPVFQVPLGLAGTWRPSPDRCKRRRKPTWANCIAP